MGVYQPLLCGLNLVLFCSSTALLYLGSVLVNFYLLPSLWLYSSNFAAVPNLIIAIGFLLFFFSIFGFVAVGSKSRVVLAVYAGLMGLLFVLQLASIFTTVELRNELELEQVLNFRHKEVDDDMSQYWTVPEVRDRWDTMQRDFQCCGVKGFEIGFRDWERVAATGKQGSAGRGGEGRGVPVSCCLREESCDGADTDSSIFEGVASFGAEPWTKIYVHGCMEIMGRRLQRDVLPLLLTYIGCAVLLALIQILALVLASAFVAAISRKERSRTKGGRYEERATQQHPILLAPEAGIKYSDTLTSGAADSGTGSGSGSLRSQRSVRLEAAPPRTPSGHRSSLHLEPSDEAGTCI